MAFVRLAFALLFYLCGIFYVRIALGAGLGVLITMETDYGDIEVKLIRQYKTKWLRHQPKVADVIKRIYLNKSQKKHYINVNEPYIDVIVKGGGCYFKIRSDKWDAQKPFQGNKYVYFRFSSDLYEEMPSWVYINVLKESYWDRGSLDLWNVHSHKYALFSQNTSDKIGHVDAFPELITSCNKPIWSLSDMEGTVFLRFSCTTHNGQNVISLYFQDLNDNILETRHILSRQFPYHIHPWIGLLGKTYFPRSVAILDNSWEDRELMGLIVSLHKDAASTPLVAYKGKVGSPFTVYISHPLTYIALFVYGNNTICFDDCKPFVVYHRYVRGERTIYTLSQVDGENVMRKIYFSGIRKMGTPIRNAATKLFTFSLYLNADYDNRLSILTYFTLGKNRATVYTAKKHLAFGRIYKCDGQLIAHENQFMSPIEQFIICNNRFYVVTRDKDGAKFLRYYKVENGQDWFLATDGYPDFIPIISDPS